MNIALTLQGLVVLLFFGDAHFVLNLAVQGLAMSLLTLEIEGEDVIFLCRLCQLDQAKKIWRGCRFVGCMFRVLGLIRLDFILAMLVKKASSMASSIAGTIGSSSVNHVRICGRSVCECSWLQKRQCVRTRSSCSLSLMSGFASCRPSSLFGEPTLVVWVTGVSFC